MQTSIPGALDGILFDTSRSWACFLLCLAGCAILQFGDTVSVIMSSRARASVLTFRWTAPSACPT